MQKDIRTLLSTSNKLRIHLRKADDDLGMTGLSNGSAGLVIGVMDDTGCGASYSTSGLQTITVIGTFQAPSAASVRFAEVDSTNFPGLYEIHLRDDLFGGAGVKRMNIHVSGVANLKDEGYEILFSGNDLGIATANQIWNYDEDDLGGAGTAGKVITDIRTQTGTTGVAIADGYLTAAKFGNGFILETSFGGDSLAAIGNVAAGLVWDLDYGTNPPAADSYGDLIVTRFDEAISSRASQASLDAVQNDTGELITITTNTGVTVNPVSKAGYQLAANGLALINAWTVNLTGNLSGSVGSVTGSVGSVTGIVSADMVRISGDTTAADNFETMLDGTGGKTLTLKNVVVNNPAGVGFSINGTTGMLISSTIDSALHLSGAVSGLLSVGGSECGIRFIGAQAGMSGGVTSDVREYIDPEIETGVGMIQALRAILGICAGVTTGAGTTTITFKNPAGDTVRVTATVDGSNNRTGIALNV